MEFRDWYSAAVANDNTKLMASELALSEVLAHHENFRRDHPVVEIDPMTRMIRGPWNINSRRVATI